jgi:hypothetical protein
MWHEKNVYNVLATSDDASHACVCHGIFFKSLKRPFMKGTITFTREKLILISKFEIPPIIHNKRTIHCNAEITYKQKLTLMRLLFSVLSISTFILLVNAPLIHQIQFLQRICMDNNGSDENCETGEINETTYQSKGV